MTSPTNNRQPRPKRSLFSFTRKRVFDSLCQRFTGFKINQDKPSSDIISFAYFGNERLTIVGGKTVVLRSYKAPFDLENNVRKYTCQTQAEVNKALVAIFAGIDAVCGATK